MSEQVKVAVAYYSSTSHVAGQEDLPITDTTRQAAAYQGARVATIAADLKAGRENARRLPGVGSGA
jgi:hypothetical protein